MLRLYDAIYQVWALMGVDADLLNRNTVSKRQIAVLICLVLAVIVWVVPPPASWKRQGMWLFSLILILVLDRDKSAFT